MSRDPPQDGPERWKAVDEYLRGLFVPPDPALDAALRATAEAGQEHTRVMVYGPVRTSRIAYRRRGKENLYPQDAELNLAAAHSYSAGIVKRAARASAIVPFEQAAARVSAAGAITLGKRQAEELVSAPTRTRSCPRLCGRGGRRRCRRRGRCREACRFRYLRSDGVVPLNVSQGL